MNANTNSLNSWQKLSRVISELLTRFPFYGHVLTSLARKMDKNIKYAAGIGIGRKSVLVINPDLFFQEKPKMRVGLLIHEIEHVIRLHVPRFSERVRGNPSLKEKANIAMDMAINCTIQTDLLPSWVIMPWQFNLPNLQTAEWYYNRLPDRMDHPVKIGIPHEEDDCSSQSRRRLVRDDFDITELEDACGGKVPTELHKQFIRDLVNQAVEQTRLSRGNVPGHVEQILVGLTQDSKIPWNILFRRHCQWASLRIKSYTKKRRSRRYGTRPGPFMKRRLKLTVAFDTSGSISNEDLAWFFSELGHMARKGAEITLIQCDAEIQKVEKYQRSFTRENPQVFGRGGTAFTPVFDYLLKERSRMPDLLVFFTDGYGDNPTDPVHFPVCWIYTPVHKKAAEFGFHIEYESNPQ